MVGIIFLIAMRMEKRQRDRWDGMNEVVGSALKEVQELLRHQGDHLQQAHVAIGERLEGNAALVGQVQNRLGQLEEANRRIIDLGNNLGKEVGDLQGIFQSPKMRGGWSELFLGDLLDQVLGPEYYELQYPFKNGERVDAVVKLSRGMVPIDAKFPLENFRKFLTASSESERQSFRREFVKDVKRHIDQIAEKYIVPDEGTLDFALMYIPAENVHYNIVVDDSHADGPKSIAQYARLKNVIPVSPNSLYLYLASVMKGLQGLKIETHAREILENIQRLKVDLVKFEEEFRRTGSHLKNAVGTYERALRQFDRFQDKLSVYELTGPSPKSEVEAVS